MMKAEINRLGHGWQFRRRSPTLAPTSMGVAGICYNFASQGALLGLLILVAPAIVHSQTNEGTAQAIVMGDLQRSGNGCLAGRNDLEFEEDGTLRLGIGLAVRKAAGSGSIARATCQVSLPIQVSAGHRLAIRQAQSAAGFNLAAGTQASVQLEVFQAGSRGELLTAEARSEGSRVRREVFLNGQDLLVTGCGESMILRANASARILGGTGRSTASMRDARLDLTIEHCD